MRHAAVAGGGEGELSRLRLEIGDQLLERRRRQRRMHHDDMRHGGGEADRREVVRRVIRQVGEKTRRDRVDRNVAHHDGVAIRRRLRHMARGDGAGRAGPVVDHDRLAEQLGEPGLQDARHYIGAAARRKAHHHAHGLRRIVLRARRGGREHEQCADQLHRGSFTKLASEMPSASACKRVASAAASRWATPSTSAARA